MRPGETHGGPATKDPRSKSFAQYLRRQLLPGFALLEQTDFDIALRKGTVTRETYLRFLQGHYLVRGALDPALESAEHLGYLLQKRFLRQEQVRRDLKLLGGSVPVRSSEGIDRIRLACPEWAKSPRQSLAGAIVALELERARLRRAAPAVAKAFGLRGDLLGLSYLNSDPERSAVRLRELGRWIDAQVKDPAQKHAVLEAAGETARGLITFYRELS